MTKRFVDSNQKGIKLVTTNELYPFTHLFDSHARLLDTDGFVFNIKKRKNQSLS